SLDEVKTRFEAGQQPLGNDLAGISESDIAAYLEVGDAEAIAANLQGKGAVSDVLAYGRRIPDLLRLVQGGEGVLQGGGIRAPLAGASASIGVALQRGRGLAQLLAQVGRLAEQQRLHVSEGDGPEVVVLDRCGRLVEHPLAPRRLVASLTPPPLPRGERG